MSFWDRILRRQSLDDQIAEGVKRALLAAPMPVPGAVTDAPKREAYHYNFPHRWATPFSPTTSRNTPLTVETLRTLADSYDVARGCIQELKRQVTGTPLEIVSREDSDRTDATKKRIKRAQRFFEDFSGGLGGAYATREDFELGWIEDVLVIGMYSILLTRNSSGKLIDAVCIDASTIRPRVDAYGWDDSSEIAFEQWVNGVVVAKFTFDELIVGGLTPRTYSPYHHSPVEWLASTIDTALKANEWNRGWLTDGTTVDEAYAMPTEWQVDQVKEWYGFWTDLHSGDLKGRHKVKFLPGGSQKVSGNSRKDQDFNEFELSLMRRTCAIFGVQPAALGFAGEQYKVSQEASLQHSRNVGAGPLLRRRKAIYDYMLRELGYPGLEVRNVVDSDEAAGQRATRLQLLVNCGIMTPNEARGSEGLDSLPGGDVLRYNGRALESIDSGDQAAVDQAKQSGQAEEDSGGEGESDVEA